MGLVEGCYSMCDAAVSLSVIIPTYNRSGFVRSCLTGLRQSGVPDLEILVTDDGSTDDTKDVVAHVNPAARYVWHQHIGTPALPRNRAFAVSRGRYVGFLDCDDQWLPGAPARAVELLDRYPDVDILFGEARVGNPDSGYQSWVEIAGQDAFWKLPAKEPEPGFRIFEPRPFFRRMAVRNPVFIGACIMRREVFEAAGQFDAELCGAADWELWLRIASRYTYGYMSEPLGIWTQHQTNMSGNHDTMNLDFCLALRKILEKCDLPEEDRRCVSAQLRHHLFGYAYRSYSRGDFRTARTRFRELLRQCGPDLRGTAYWLVCALPFGLPGVLRRLKHSLSRPDQSRADA
jgi:glycosyltransferase involved in cell wall biosynthesis